MYLKQDKRDQACALFDTAMHKRSFAKKLLDDAEADLVKGKELMHEWEQERKRKKSEVRSVG